MKSGAYNFRVTSVHEVRLGAELPLPRKLCFLGVLISLSAYLRQQSLQNDECIVMKLLFHVGLLFINRLYISEKIIACFRREFGITSSLLKYHIL